MRKIIILSIIASIILGCGPQKYPIEIVNSPSGKYQIKATINTDESDKAKYLCVKLHLLDAQGKELSQLQSNVSQTMKWAIGWMGKDDIVIFHSSDLVLSQFYFDESSIQSATSFQRNEAPLIMSSRGSGTTEGSSEAQHPHPPLPLRWIPPPVGRRNDVSLLPNLLLYPLPPPAKHAK